MEGRDDRLKNGKMKNLHLHQWAFNMEECVGCRKSLLKIVEQEFPRCKHPKSIQQDWPEHSELIRNAMFSEFRRQGMELYADLEDYKDG